MKLSSSFVLLVGADAFDIKQYLLMQNQMNMSNQLNGGNYDMKQYLLTQQNKDIMTASNTKGGVATGPAADKNLMSDYLLQINSVSSNPLSFADILMGGESMTGISKDAFIEQQKTQMMKATEIGHLLLQFVSSV